MPSVVNTVTSLTQLCHEQNFPVLLIIAWLFSDNVELHTTF